MSAIDEAQKNTDRFDSIACYTVATDQRWLGGSLLANTARICTSMEIKIAVLDTLRKEYVQAFQGQPASTAAASLSKTWAT